MQLTVFLLAALAATQAFAQSSPLLDILTQELDRNFSTFKQKADPAPYFMGYSVVDEQTDVIAGRLGVLQAKNHGHSRSLDITIRVGTPKFDNYHIVGGERATFTSGSAIPIEDNPDAIKRRLWIETDRNFRGASQRITNLRTSTKVNVAAEDLSDDFSVEPPSVYIEPMKHMAVNTDEWAAKVRKWSGELSQYSGVLSGGVTVLFENQTKYLVTTEGTRLQHGRGFARIVISAQGKASDGMDLSASDTFEAEQASGLPNEAVVIAAVNKVGKDLDALLKAPTVDPFVGPAILSGRASGVFFHEIFGHRVEGHRQRDETDGQTFTKRIGQSVLPDFLSVVFDPTRARIGNVDLNGTYLYDDEGVKGRPVTVVDKGILKTFLMSRSPIKDLPQSNGHGRRQAGAEVVSRQSNLIVESSKTVSEAELHNMLIAEIKRQGKPYGFYFQNITGGFTLTGRRSLAAFKVIPLIVYRVYPDGKPDELVRGVDIVGTPLSSFSRILATSDKTEVFNGYCGAESGSVPVSAVSPAILVSEIEIQRKEKGNDRPPLLLPPFLTGGRE